MIAIVRNLILRFNLPSISFRQQNTQSVSLLAQEMIPSDSSNKLAALTQRLSLHKPPPLSPDDFEKDSHESNGMAIPLIVPDEATTNVSGELREFVPRIAAVLVCLFEGDDGELRVIMTKRSQRLSSHSGEVSLPGGKEEEGDRDVGETARREAYEEIGLDPSLVDVVTTLRPLMSKNHLVVVPVVGILRNRKSFTPVVNPDEVEDIFDAPLEMFIKDENHRVEEREMLGAKYLLQYFDHETEGKRFEIWGLTACILIQAASLAYQRPPAFPVKDPKFKFPKYVIKNPSPFH